MARVLVAALFFAHLCGGRIVPALPQRSDDAVQWVESVNVTRWYSPLDLCLIRNDSSLPMDAIISHCEGVASKGGDKGGTAVLQPTRCRAGNSWPSRGGFCSAVDTPYSQRISLRSALKGYDDPSRSRLREFFLSLQRQKGSLLLVGDSVMQQFYSAIACELEREGVWADPSQFTNTDETKYVDVMGNTGSNSHKEGAVAIKFTPIYHFVNGRYDKVANASMVALKKAIGEMTKSHDALVVVLNMGLHYLNNPVKDFSRKDYISQMSMCLRYLHTRAGELLVQQGKRMLVVWRETSAQHFPTPSGYWPGLRYAAGMKVGCVPIADVSPAGDWRNSDIAEIIRRHALGDRVRVMPFFNVTAPLWDQHVNGHKQDCTHFCWTPFLYQSSFQYLLDVVMKE